MGQGPDGAIFLQGLISQAQGHQLPVLCAPTLSLSSMSLSHGLFQQR